MNKLSHALDWSLAQTIKISAPLAKACLLELR